MCCRSSCCCGTGRNCCAPIVPVNEKAKNYRIALYCLIAVHFAVLIVKMIYMGIFSGLTDLVAITVLIIAIIRFDYCQVMIYIFWHILAPSCVLHAIEIYTTSTTSIASSW